MNEQTISRPAAVQAANNEKSCIHVSRGTVDILNSLSWFFMDAFWMLQLPKACVCCIVPTAVTGIALLFTNKKNRPLMLMDISTNCWIWMNFFWILQDMWELDYMMPYVKILTIIGIVCLLVAVKMSGDLSELFCTFRSFPQSFGNNWKYAQTGQTGQDSCRKNRSDENMCPHQEKTNLKYLLKLQILQNTEYLSERL